MTDIAKALNPPCAAEGPGLRPYQVEQVEAIAGGLAAGGIGQVHAACGSGKTLTAQRAAERLLPAGGTVAVLAPSLALVAQTLTSWRGYAAVPIGAMLAVCGDDTVTDAPVHLPDIPADVTTDPETTAKWLRTPAAGLRLIVGTYVSAGCLAEAVRDTGPLDLLILDEAHHLAGRPDFTTRKIVDPAWLPAVRRLYLTATPRTDQRIDPGAEGPVRYLSMDDPTVFGPVLHNYPFARAIAEGYLEDYRIAVVGVADSTARALLADGTAEYVDRIGGAPLQTFVAQAALARARDLYGVRRAITFHPTVDQSAEFARTLPGTLKSLPDLAGHADGLYANHVHGSMDHRRRGAVLDHLRTPVQDGWTVISNARCLGEGVDVPAVDAVLFAHPKRSAVDIVQAVGRALRRHPDTSGPSTIIVPIVVPDTTGEVGDLDAREYDTLWQVIRALRAHDEPLGLALDTQRSHDSTHNPQLPGKITVLLPQGTSQGILEQLTVLLVRQTTSSWWQGHSRAAAWHAEHKHLDIPLRYTAEDGFRLGQWLVKQRQYQGKGWLAADRVAALDKLGIEWDPSQARWLETYRSATAWHAEHGHLDIPYTRADGQHDLLGQWIVRQRQFRRAGNLSAERIAALNAIDMIWEHRDAAWQRNLDALAAYRVEYGDTLVPQRHVTSEGLRLGAWVSQMRAKRAKDALPKQRIADLEEAGMVWRQDHPARVRYLEAARAFHAEHGHLDVPPAAVYQGVELGAWIARQRTEYAAGKLLPERVQELEGLAIRWAKPPRPQIDGARAAMMNAARFDAAFERGMAVARAFHAEHGHLQPARGTTVDGLRLDAWLYRQRTRNLQGKLTTEQIRVLDELGIRWSGRE